MLRSLPCAAPTTRLATSPTQSWALTCPQALLVLRHSTHLLDSTARPAMAPTLLSLPTELKVRIVQMFARQEDAWLVRHGDITREQRKLARQATGDGLGNVALVCKELNSLAAQFLFQVSFYSRLLLVQLG